MRVPMSLQRTTPSKEPLNYVNVDAPAEAFGFGVARALGGLGETVQNYVATVKAREDKKTEFNIATSFAAFSSGMNESLGELQRTYDPRTQNFVEEAENLYRVRANNFIAENVPQDFADEYRYKLELMRGEIVGNALKVQYTEQDKYFRQNVDDAYQQALINVRNNPDSFDDESQKLADVLATSGLSDVEQLETARNLRRGLQAAFYKGGVEQGIVTPDAIGIGNTGRDSYFAKLKKAESGGRADAKSDTSSATGLYQFIESTWAGLIAKYPNAGLTPDGRTDPKQQEIAVRLFTEENAAALKAAGLPENHANLHALHFLGAGGTRVLTAPDNAPLSDYVSADKIKANSFLEGMTVADFKRWSAGKMNTNPVLDPRLEGMNYGDRETLFADVESDRQRAAAAEKAQLTQAKQAYLDLIGTQIINGQYGRTELKADLDLGKIDADNYWSLKTRIDSVAEDQRLGALFMDAVESGSLLDLNDTDVKKGANKFFEISSGKQQLADHNAAYGQMLALGVTRTGVLPPDAAAYLSSMITSGLPADARYASGVIDAIKTANPTVLGRQFSADTLKKAEAMRVAQKYGMNEEQIGTAIARIQGEDVSLWNTIDPVAEKSRASKFERYSFGRITREFGVKAQTVPGPALAQLTRDYNQLHTEGYRIFREENQAHDYAIGQLKQVWDVTKVGGNTSLVQFPIEKQFPTFTPDEIDGNVRRELQLNPDDEYVLLSDDRTAAAATAEDAPPPSYLVVKTNPEDGGYVTVLDADNNNRPLRYYPTVDEFIDTARKNEQLRIEEDIEYSRLASELSRVETEIARIEENNLWRMRAGESVDPIPEAWLTQRDTLRRTNEAIVAERRESDFRYSADAIAVGESYLAKQDPEAIDFEGSANRLKSDLAQQNPVAVAQMFTGTWPARSNADFAAFIREQLPSGPMQSLAKTNPKLAREVLDQFWKTSGYDKIPQLMSFHNKVAVYDAVFALTHTLKDVQLNENYQKFVDDPRAGIKFPLRELVQKENPAATQDQFNKAMLTRLVKSRLVMGIFY